MRIFLKDGSHYEANLSLTDFEHAVELSSSGAARVHLKISHHGADVYLNVDNVAVRETLAAALADKHAKSASLPEA